MAKALWAVTVAITVSCATCNTADTAQPVEPIPTQPVEAPTLRRATADDIGCIIKPVMTDDELRRCGATPPKYD